jgi:endonuclease/exonuclease/phosphatase family metal-dependent hydrolase
MKLLSWNIQWGRGADGRVDLERIVAHARRFADFDVLCLQEVSAGFQELPGSDGSDQYAALSALLPGYTALAGVAFDAFGADGRERRFGNMLLTRLPVRQVFRHLLPWPAQAGVMSMQRLAVEATLEAAFGPLRVTTTHLEYYSAEQRAAQIERLRELHRQAVAHARTRRPGEKSDGPFEFVEQAAPAVLTGDFNCRPGTPELARLLAPFDDDTPPYRDAWAVAHGTASHEPTVGVHDKDQWPGDPFTFDFCFVSADLADRVRRIAVDPSTPASDHQPVLLELR